MREANIIDELVGIIHGRWRCEEKRKKTLYRAKRLTLVSM